MDQSTFLSLFSMKTLPSTTLYVNPIYYHIISFLFILFVSILMIAGTSPCAWLPGSSTPHLSSMDAPPDLWKCRAKQSWATTASLLEQKHSMSLQFSQKQQTILHHRRKGNEGLEIEPNPQCCYSHLQNDQYTFYRSKVQVTPLHSYKRRSSRQLVMYKHILQKKKNDHLYG